MSVLNGDVLRSELLRFKWLTLALVLVHFGALALFNRLADMQQQPWMVDRFFILVYMAVAFAWAVFQVGSYRKPSKWLWLLHRPLPHRSVYASMVTVAAINLFLSACLPMLTVLLILDFGSDRLIDTHHYLMPMHAFVLALSAWLAGVCTVLSVRLTAAVVLVLPIWLMWSMAHSLSLLLLESLGLLALLAIASTQFKPNRDAEVRSLSLVLLTALPLQIGVYFVLTVSAIGYEFMLMFAGVHPLNMSMPPRNGFTEAMRQESPELLTALLSVSDDARAPQWREQVPVLTSQSIYTRLRNFPVRHQAYKERVLQWADPKQQIEWTYSHDDSLYHGRDLRSGQSKGVWGEKGRDDRTPFPLVPSVFQEQYLLTARTIYQLDTAQGRTLQQIHLDEGEVFISPPLIFGEQVLAITSRGVRLYGPDRATYDQTAGTVRQISERQVWRIPGVPFIQAMGSTQGAGSLSRLDAAELIDGWLIGLTFGGYYTGDNIQQMLLHVDPQGQVNRVAQRQLGNDFSIWYETVNWWLSPLHYVLRHAPTVLLDNGNVQGVSLSIAPAASQIAMALSLCAASMLCAFLWMRQTTLSGTRKTFWLLMTLIGSLPALASLMIIEKRKPIAIAGMLPSGAPA